MQTRSRFATVVSLCLVLACAGALAEDAEMRTWKSAAGSTLEASYQKYAYGRVYLKKADGSVVQIALTGLSAEDQAYVKSKAAPAASASAPSKPLPKGVLSDADVEKLAAQSFSEKRKRGYRFDCYATVDTKDPRDKKTYKGSDKVPVRIICTFYEIKEVGGKKIERAVYSNSVRFYLKDEDGNVVLNDSASLSTMCPT